MLTPQRAIELKNKFEHIVGRTYKGKEITSLVIMPRDNPEFNLALGNY